MSSDIGIFFPFTIMMVGWWGVGGGGGGGRAAGMQCRKINKMVVSSIDFNEHVIN